jgi:hypothetical protein
VAYYLCITHGSPHGIIKDQLGFLKVRVRWVLKQLTGQHRHICLTFCHGLLNHCHNESDAFLRSSVTGDTMWIHNSAPESKHQGTEWRNLTLPVKKNVRVKKLFWDAQGPVFEHCEERDRTVNCVCYSEMLRDQLKPAIWTKCRGLLLKRVSKLHDMPVITLPLTPLKASANWNLRCWRILCMVLIWLLLTITCLIHSLILWEASISPVTRKWKKQCMHTEAHRLLD